MASHHSRLTNTVTPCLASSLLRSELKDSPMKKARGQALLPQPMSTKSLLVKRRLNIASARKGKGGSERESLSTSSVKPATRKPLSVLNPSLLSPSSHLSGRGARATRELEFVSTVTVDGGDSDSDSEKGGGISPLKRQRGGARKRKQIIDDSSSDEGGVGDGDADDAYEEEAKVAGGRRGRRATDAAKAPLRKKRRYSDDSEESGIDGSDKDTLVYEYRNGRAKYMLPGLGMMLSRPISIYSLSNPVSLSL
jgi:hypothetical protein